MNKVEILKKKLEDANWFITEIAKMLNIDTDGVGYDDIQLSLDDFQEAIKNLPNELKGVSNNEQKENNCLLNLPKGDCVTKNSFKYCPVSCRWRQL